MYDILRTIEFLDHHRLKNDMCDILRTIEFLDHHRLKNEIVAKKMQSCFNKMTKKKMILVKGVTARK